MTNYTIFYSVQYSQVDDYYSSNAPIATHSSSSPLTLRSIRNGFPFEGKYHYRIRVSAISSLPHQYLWMDLVDDDEVVSHQDEQVFVKALLLEVPEIENDTDIEKSYEDYLMVMKPTEPRNRPERFPVEAASSGPSQQHQPTSTANILQKIKSGVKTLSKEANDSNITKIVTSGATSVWQTLKASIASHLTSSDSILSDIAEENLAHLSEALATVYTDVIPEHVSILKEVWSGQLRKVSVDVPVDRGRRRIGLFPNEGFQRNSSTWKHAGFQNTDPVNDLKTSGLLALRAITYLSRNYPRQTQTMLANNKENTKSKYPFAIVAVNLTLLLAELLNLRDQRYLSAQAGYWEMFESPSTFYEMFCLLFFHIDNTWKLRNAVRADFAKIIGDTKATVNSILERSPKSLTSFKEIARDSDMLIGDV